jgi:hypothetical protein
MQRIMNKTDKTLDRYLWTLRKILGRIFENSRLKCPDGIPEVLIGVEHYQSVRTIEQQQLVCLEILTKNIKGRAVPFTGLDGPRGFQDAEAPRFQDNRYMNVVRLSAPRTGRLYPPGNILDSHFLQTLCRPQGHRNVSQKNSNDTTYNRSRNLPACSAVPHSTAPRRARWNI